MDIIYQLPFPEVICNKIFMFACKSPHSGLGSGILKIIIKSPYIYNKLVERGGIVLDGDGNVVKFRVRNGYKTLLTENEMQKKMTFDIAHLRSLPNLTEIDLGGTRVSGDIVHLKSLHNLTKINFQNNTDITGNIAHLNLMPNLTRIDLYRTGVSGDIAHLTSLPNLDMIDISYARVSGESSAFRNYRKSAGLKKCSIYFNWL